jgi:protein SCO1/2
MYCSIIGLFVFNSSAQIVTEDAKELKQIDVIEKLGEQIPLDLSFIDSKSKQIQLSDYFNSGKPVILTLAYYECPMLCTFVLNGLSNGVGALSFNPGVDFQMITVSIDPKETPKLAAAKQKNQLAAIGRDVAIDSWEFLTGNEDQIERLADAVGFIYYYDEDRDEYAHAAVSFILTETGEISRYLYGIEFKPNDLRFALMEASQGKIGDTLDRLLLYCYHYDPEAKGYVLFAGNVMRIGGVITVMILGGILTVFWRKEMRKRSLV